MQAGRLRNKVTIQAPGMTQAEDGQPIASWSTLATVWADIRTQGGLESIKSGAVTSVVKASVRIRHRTDITAGMRILHGSTTYHITAVLPDVAKRQYVDLVCEVVV